jgi:hypothetical protein
MQVAEQCWAVGSDGQRCGRTSKSGTYFCPEHGWEGGPEPAGIWRAPVCEMPPGLVVRIRANDPNAVFPAAAPEDPSPLALPFLQATPVSSSDPAPAASPFLPADPTPSPLAWLLTTLQTAIEGVMAGEATPLQKASAVARLGNLYLKAYRAAEFEKENKQLAGRVGELEEQLVSAQAEAARMEQRGLALAERLTDLLSPTSVPGVEPTDGVPPGASADMAADPTADPANDPVSARSAHAPTAGHDSLPHAVGWSELGSGHRAPP